MRRIPTLLAMVPVLLGCPSYDRYSPVAGQDGLVPADQFAAYGAEQAQSVAIGRAYAQAWTGDGLEQKTRQATIASDYARALPDVTQVTADPQANLLTVTFRSGWRKAVVPIDDGVPPDRTVGLPPRAN